MSLTRVRFTVRGMMVAVVVVAVGLAGTVLLPRMRMAPTYRNLAASHAQQERLLLRLATDHAERGTRYLRLFEQWRGTDRGRAISYKAEAMSAEYAAKECRVAAGHHDHLRLEYERAARFPWLPLTDGAARAEMSAKTKL